MRPLAIDVQGFTCFRDAQPTLDLSSLSLFAITGPTGAGKSSVLDAITFALYGRVPRMGGASVKDLISHGRDRMTVTLRFAARDREFVVTRTVRRTATAGLCQLDEIVGAARTTLAHGARDVTSAVERLVGLDYDAFTHAVILPQGEFARFLKGDPAQRRRILQDLLRLTVYTRMQKIAGERWRDAKRDLDSYARQLVAYAEASPEAVAHAERELAAATAARPGLVDARDAARSRRLQCEARLARAHELAARRVDLQRVRRAHADHALREQRLQESRRAAFVGPSIDAVDREAALQDQRDREHAAVTARLEDARAAARRATEHVAAAAARRDDLEPSRARLARLQALEGTLQHRDALLAECRLLERDVDALASEVDMRAAAVRTCERRVAETRAETVRLAASVAAVQLDARELATCEQGRDLARELRSARDHGPVVEFALRQAQDAEREAGRLALVAGQACETARAALAEAEVQRAQAARILADAQDRWRAMTLRSHLHAGDSCPVCAQHVAVVPPLELAPELAELIEAEQECIESCRISAHLLDVERERHVRALAAAEGARTQRATAERARAELAARMTHSIHALRTLLRTYLPASSESMPEHWLLERLETLQGDRAQREVRERQVQAAEAAARDAEHATALARQALEACRRELDARRAQRAARDTELARLDADVRAVTDAVDPRAEQADLVRQLTAADGEYDTARLAAVRADAELAAAAAAEAHAARARAEAAANLQVRQATLDAALAEYGFLSIEHARAARLAPAMEATLQGEIDSHVRELAALSARVAELEAEAGSDAVTDGDLGTCRDDEEKADRAVDDNVRRHARLEAELTAMRARLAQASALQTQLDDARATQDVQARLSSDLKADAFQAWLLRECFERIVEGASLRLMELSGRYTLQWTEDAFCVVDHDNAQERRPADTLSGGETFLASLALALELSDQVQRAAGAVRLDSLFIDEGFGTLDATAQDTVATAIESLQVAGRMVGIITHVRELTDRMPACIVIEKRPEGSRWSIAR